MTARLGPARALLLIALAGAPAACLAPSLESPDGPPRRTFHGCAGCPSSLKNKVDLLFMIDNSNSMDAMQAELKSKFGELLQPFQDLADQGTYADLNIGVVTSDFGAGATGAPGCTPSGLQGGGDQGKLQGIGRRAPSTCVKPIGTNFIHYAFGPTGPSKSNLPGTQGLVETFTCMASVGSSGCGFEHQLEAVYAALHNNIPDNQGSQNDPGFVRDDAQLVVVFLTNEDDASAPPDTDLFDKNKVAQYGYEDSYSRQTRFGVMCGRPPAFPPYGDSHGPLEGCIPAPNPDGVTGPGKLYDVQRYIDFFAKPAIEGGAKTNPLDVLLVGIDAPETPFQVLLSDPGTPAGSPYVPCGPLDDKSKPPCVPVLQHSCFGPAPDPARPDFHPFFGDPAVRLNTVLNSVPQSLIASICDDSYGPALRAAAEVVVASIGVAGCIPDAFPVDPVTGQLVFDCQVEDDTVQADGTYTDVPIPRCEDDNPDGPHATVPCWVISHRDACRSYSPDSVAFTIDRGHDSLGHRLPAPPHTATLYDCRTRTP